MGVHGLWQLISSTGKPVPLDSLEGKILAVDVSVWLHQLAKGMRDGSGNPVPNAHLHGLFTRICKLLHCRIKPVFVFDGAAPELKKKTLAARRNKREDAEETSAAMQQKILTNLIRSQALKEALGEGTLSKLPTLPKGGNQRGKRDAIYELPPLPETSKVYMSEVSEEHDTVIEKRELQEFIEEEYADLNAVDVESLDFKSLPAELQHELIEDMKLKKKNYNLSKIVELPEDSKDFSNFQMAKLLKYNKLNTRLEEVRKELNQRQTKDLGKYYSQDYYGTSIHSQRVVSDDMSHYVLIKGIKKRKEMEREEKERLRRGGESFVVSEESSTTDELLQDSENEEIEEIDFTRVSPQDIMEKVDVRAERRKGKDEEVKSTTGRAVCVKEGGIRFIEGEVASPDKERFRPVIEIDTSESSEAESDDEAVKDEIDDDVQVIQEEFPMLHNVEDGVEGLSADKDLQYAIELSLKDQGCVKPDTENRLKLKPSKGTKSRGTEPVHLTDKPTCSGKSEKLEGNFCARQTKSAIHDDIKVKHKRSSEISEKHESAKKLKTLTAADKDVEGKKGKKVVEFENKEDHANVTSASMTFMEVTKERKGTGNILKRRKSDMSNGDDEDSKEDVPKRRKIIDDSGDRAHDKEDDDMPRRIKVIKEPEETEPIDVDDAMNGDEKEEDSSDSEDGDLMEVKIDMNTVKEDELFPASMFEVQDDEQEEEGEKDEEEAEAEKDEEEAEAEEEEAEGNLNSKIDSVSFPIEETEAAALDDDTSDTPARVSDDEELDVENGEDVEKEGGDDSDMEEEEVNVATADTGEQPVEEPAAAAAAEREVKSPEVIDLVKAFKSMEESNIRGLKDSYDSQARVLQQEKGRQARLAASITDQMHADAQELLHLFGIPYIVSPSEAEAQCAQLDKAHLTHGTITDDSDIWLFGGSVVYKNFFNQAKYVECFKDVHIKSQLGLSRETLINLALLCGSDYTEGVQGVGPVTAMEILVQFTGEGTEGLVKLQSWWEASQKQIKIPSESKLLSKIRSLDLKPGFPNPLVVDAYLCPMVDESSEKFSWALPDLEQLRQYATAKLGWSRNKADELLLPVLKRLNYKQTQRPITSFLQPEVYIQPAKMKSKRLQTVVNKFLNIEESTDTPTGGNTEQKVVRGKGKAKEKAKDKADVTGDKKNGDKEGCNETGDTETAENKKRKSAKGRGQRKQKDEMDEVSATIDDGGKSEIGKGKQGPGRGRGRGRGRSQGSKGKTDQDIKDKKETKPVIFDNIVDSGTSESESDSDISDTDTTSTESEEAMAVTESSLSVAEILGLKMGVHTFEEAAEQDLDVPGTSGLGGANTRVFETGLKVEELMKLQGGDADMENMSGASDTYPELIDDDVDMEEDVLHEGEKSDSENSEFYKNEGGFIHEENEEDEESHESFKRRVAKGKDREKPKPEKVKGSKTKTLDKNESTNIINNENLSAVTEISNQKDLNQQSKKSDLTPAAIEKQDRLKPKPDSINDSDKEDKTKKFKHRAGKKGTESAKASKTEKKGDNDNKSKAKAETVPKTEPTIFSNEPIRKTASGVPWADVGRKKGHKGKGGSGLGSLKRSLQLVEKIEKRTKEVKAARKPIGVVNLSESDSDSST